MKHFSMNFKNVPHPGESMELFDDIEDDSELLKAAAQWLGTKRMMRPTKAAFNADRPVPCSVAWLVRGSGRAHSQ
jgi:hypothetical protein